MTSVRQSDSARLADLTRWGNELRHVLEEMETANGEHGDDTESLIRVAWRDIYRRAELLRTAGVTL